MTKLFTHQCTRTFPCLPPFPSFKAFSIQRPVRSNSPSKFSSSVSSTSMDICSYFSELGIATLSFRTDSTCVMPASWSAPLRLRVKTLRRIYVSEDIQMRRRCKWGGLTYPPMKSSSFPGTRVSDMVIGGGLQFRIEPWGFLFLSWLLFIRYSESASLFDVHDTEYKKSQLASGTRRQSYGL
jgi:hypothetical protein